MSKRNRNRTSKALPLSPALSPHSKACNTFRQPRRKGRSLVPDRGNTVLSQIKPRKTRMTKVKWVETAVSHNSTSLWGHLRITASNSITLSTCASQLCPPDSGACGSGLLTCCFQTPRWSSKSKIPIYTCLSSLRRSSQQNTLVIEVLPQGTSVTTLHGFFITQIYNLYPAEEQGKPEYSSK